MYWCNYPQHTSNPPALGTAKIAAFLNKNYPLMGPGLPRSSPVLLKRGFLTFNLSLPLLLTLDAGNRFLSPTLQPSPPVFADSVLPLTVSSLG